MGGRSGAGRRAHRGGKHPRGPANVPVVGPREGTDDAAGRRVRRSRWGPAGRSPRADSLSPHHARHPP